MSKNKMILANALKELCKTKPLDHVTVTEITRKAGLTRQIFYHCFIDKYELAKWIHINDYIASLINQNMNENEVIQWKDISKEWLRIIEKQKDFYRNLYYSSSENQFLHLIHQHILDTYKHILYSVEKENPSSELIFQVEFFCTGVTLKIHEWVKYNTPYSADTLCELIFLSMPKEVERITSMFSISKKELVDFSRTVASQSEV